MSAPQSRQARVVCVMSTCSLRLATAPGALQRSPGFLYPIIAVQLPFRVAMLVLPASPFRASVGLRSGPCAGRVVEPECTVPARPRPHEPLHAGHAACERSGVQRVPDAGRLAATRGSVAPVASAFADDAPVALGSVGHS